MIQGTGILFDMHQPPMKKAPSRLTECFRGILNLTGREKEAVHRLEKAQCDPSLFHIYIIPQMQYDIQ